MLKVGLTGGIGSGKSTVSKMFKEKQIPIIDADIIAREVLEIYPQILDNIKKEFGEQFIDENGKLKRRELGSFIFDNEKRRLKLEEIMIPYIKKEIYDRMEEYNKSGIEMCVADVPTLIEQEIYKKMDVNILVWVDRNTQIERVKKRDQLEEKEVLKRINAQMSLEDKKRYVDYFIDNSKDLENTESEFNRVLKALKELKGEK